MSHGLVLQVGLCQVQLVKGDITRIAVDAIVNAANSALAGGGGVDGAIHEAGGPELMRELDKVRSRVGRCETGNAVTTGAARLPAKYVFHTVGPVYRGGKQGEAEKLASCYRVCLALAKDLNLRTISFPSISAGVYGYPIEEAAEIALRTVMTWLRENPEPIRTLKLVQYGESDHEVYRKCAQRLHDPAVRM